MTRPDITYPLQFARLVHLLRLPDSTAAEVMSTLRHTVALARAAALTLEVCDGRVTVGGAELALDRQEMAVLADRLDAHGVGRVVVRPSADIAELLKVARFLAAPPEDGPEPGVLRPVEQRVEPLKLWSVGVIGRSSAAPAPDLLSADLAAVAERLERLGAGGAAAASACVELAAGAEADVAAGRAEAVALALMGLVRGETDATDPGTREACGTAIARLSTAGVTRLVAQLLPRLAGRDGAYAEYLAALGRCGQVGEAALIAHLMAAQTIEERRTFYEAIVRLRAGIPMLIDALGHAQWFVVRNAACLLGDMRVAGADVALAGLLDHADARVREAAAGALTRLDTPQSRAAILRMLRDRSAAVRQHGALGFAAGTQARVAAPLAAALEVEDDEDVRLSILAALGRLATPDAVQKLVRAALPSLGRPRSGAYRVAALEALVAASFESAAPVLRGLADDGDPAVREAAARLAAQAAPRAAAA